MVQASATLVGGGTGSIPAGDSSFVFAALYQRMKMAIVKSLHKLNKLKYTLDKTETILTFERGFFQFITRKVPDIEPCVRIWENIDLASNKFAVSQ